MMGRIMEGAGAAQAGADASQLATEATTGIDTAKLLQNPEFVAQGTGAKAILPLQPGTTAPPAALNIAGQSELANLAPNHAAYIAQKGAKGAADFAALNPSFMDSATSAFSQTPMQGFSNIGTAAMSDPLALGTLGTTGMMYGSDMMQAQQAEAYEQYLAEREEAKKTK